MNTGSRSLMRRVGIGLCAALPVAALLSLGSSGCAGVVETEAEGLDSPARDESFSAGGARQVATFAMPWGQERLDYEVINGRRIHDGDMILPEPLDDASGPISRLVGSFDPSMRWPNNTVAFSFDASMPESDVGLDRADVRTAMAQWEAATSIRFVESPGTQGRMVFKRDLANADHCSSQVGFSGSPQDVMLGANCSTGNALHEIGHGVGLKHEHEHPRRDAYLSTVEGCGASPLSLGGTFGMYGMYDFTSMMHYSSAIGTVIPGCIDGGTLRFFRSSSSGANHDQVYSQRNDLSALDRLAVEEMYSEGFGAAVAFGDFNGDGLRDVAIGAPRKGSVGGGHVQIFRGSANGLVAVDDLDQGANGQRDDRFGASLATGDFDGDGFTDLAVGVPGEDTATGRVVVYRGRSSNTNLVTRWLDLDQTGLGSNEVADRFGYSLAAGDFDNDGKVDLAIGAPGESWGTSTPDAGAVFVFRGGSNTMTGAQLLGQSGLGSNESGDSFGASLTTGDFDNDGKADLAVGAPHERFGTDPEGGGVFLFHGGASLTGWRVLRPESPSTNYNEWSLLFGFTLTASDYDGDGKRDLAVGAPGATVNGAAWAGRVLVFRGTADGPTTVWQSLTESAPTRGAAFGFSLASGKVNTDSKWDLAVGAPGSQPAASVASGRAYVYAGNAVAMTVLSTLSQAGLGTNEAGDRLGHDLALGDIDGDGDRDLIAGAPGELVGNGPQTGFAFSYRSNGTSLSTWAGVASP